MDKDKAIKFLQEQIEQIDEVKNHERFSSVFKKWYRDARVVIEKIFGENSRHIEDFVNIEFFGYNTTTTAEDIMYFQEGLSVAKMILISMQEELEKFGNSQREIKGAINPLDKIKNICTKFHLVARQLRARYNDRDTLDVEDEYDVQDLLHALLRLEFDDIRAEEWIPSYAGKSARVDFLLKNEEIIIEVKKTRKGLTHKEVGDQLLIDIERYQSHPNCKYLVCFVYDPEGKIANPIGMENDLTKEINGVKIITIISPKF